jgi:RNA polymerase-binding transcription factor DksA
VTTYTYVRTPPIDDIDAPSRLSARQRDTIGALLTTAWEASIEQAARCEAELSSLADAPGDIAADDREAMVAALARARAGVDETRQALMRLQDGTYGLCLSCGRPVPFERLEAIPETQLCVSCSRVRPSWR